MTLAFEPSPKTTIPLFRAFVGGSSSLPAICSICGLRQVCFPCDLMQEEVHQAGEMVATDRRVKQGDALFRTGDHFHYLYTVRSGSVKTVQSLRDGREQVTGFQMTGDMLGAEAIGSQKHGCDAIAIEESRVCSILFSRIESLGRARPEMQHELRKAMSGEIVRQHDVLLLLGVMTAEERVAIFLLNLSQRLKARGYSPTDFILRMTRRDIGSYLGMKLETVSRMLSKFRNDGLIDARHKHIHVLDLAGLRSRIRQSIN